MKLDEHDGRELISLARECIDTSLRLGRLPPLPEVSYRPSLQRWRSAFVTLRARDELRGCCGSIEPSRPLAEEVWHNAWASAFRDPRFPPLSANEWPSAHLHISALEAPRSIEVESEDALIARLRPGIDGLILQLNGARATFLPAVWDQLGDTREFVRHLKVKAGWPPDFWSPQMQVAIYEVEEVMEVM